MSLSSRSIVQAAAFATAGSFALQDEVVRRQREASSQQCELHRDTATETICVIGQVARAAVQ